MSCSIADEAINFSTVPQTYQCKITKDEIEYETKFIQKSFTDNDNEDSYLMAYYFECINSSNNNMFTKLMEYDYFTCELCKLIPLSLNFFITSRYSVLVPGSLN